MIEFSNGHKLTFCNGSGALGFDGNGWWWEQPLRWLGILNPKAFTVVAKTITEFPLTGNLSMWHPWTCVRTLKDKKGRRGAVNAIGLTNPGCIAWFCTPYQEAIRKEYSIACSVKAENPAVARSLADFLEMAKQLAYVEVNISCPNVKEIPSDITQILANLKKAGHPLVLKLSYDQVTEEFIKATEPYVEAYHAINTIPWAKIFPDKKSPIEKYPHLLQGGVSGDFIHQQAVDAVRYITKLTPVPVIGGGGIFNLNDVLDFEHAGAKAFSIGTCFLLRPWRPNRIVKQYNERK